MNVCVCASCVCVCACECVFVYVFCKVRASCVRRGASCVRRRALGVHRECIVCLFVLACSVCVCTRALCVYMCVCMFVPVLRVGVSCVSVTFQMCLVSCVVDVFECMCVWFVCGPCVVGVFICAVCM